MSERPKAKDLVDDACECAACCEARALRHAEAEAAAWRRRAGEVARERDELAGKVVGLTHDYESVKAERDRLAAELERTSNALLSGAPQCPQCRRFVGPAQPDGSIYCLACQRLFPPPGPGRAELEAELARAQAELRDVLEDGAIYIVEDGRVRPKGSVTRVPIVEAQEAWLELRSLKSSIRLITENAAPLKPAEFIKLEASPAGRPCVTVAGADGVGFCAPEAESITIRFPSR